jgi:hypothetical protein
MNLMMMGDFFFKKLEMIKANLIQLSELVTWITRSDHSMYGKPKKITV